MTLSIYKDNHIERPTNLGIVALCLMSMSGCVTPDLKQTRETEDLNHAIANLRASQPSLNLGDMPRPSEPLSRYRHYYGLNFPQAAHHFGYVSSGAYKLATQVWRASGVTRGTVYLVHGYYNHVGLLRPLIDYFLEAGYHVVAFDLPGHGLSSGMG